MPSPTSISIQQLARLIGVPQGPLVVDVRTDADFAADLDHVVADSATFEQLGDLVHAVALGDGRQVAVDVGSPLAGGVRRGVEFDQVVADAVLQLGELRLGADAKPRQAHLWQGRIRARRA